MDSSRTLPSVPESPGIQSLLVAGFASILPVLAACALLLALAALAAAAAPAGDKHSLRARHRAGELTRVELAMEVGGDLKLVADDGQGHDLPMSVVANLKWDEALLTLDAAGRPARSARHYDDVRAVIKIDKGGEKPTLDAARRLIVAERADTGPGPLYCPSEPLSRDELDLIDLPGNPLVFDELLPEEPVAVGDTWKLADKALAALLCLDAVSWSEVQAALGEVQGHLADISAAGPISAAVGGIGTEIELKIKFKFDLQAKRITQFAMLIKEKRAVGHVGPGLDTVAKVLMRLTPIAASETLTPEILARIPQASSPDLLALGYAPPGGQFRVQYDRRWIVTGDDAKLASLRLLDRGELVAQCNVAALPRVAKPVTLMEFQRDVERSLGDHFGQFASAGQSVNEAGYAVFRVVARGTVGQLPIEWIYYLVQDREGRRVSLAFTLEQALQQRFADADRAIVSALRLTDSPAPTAARPRPTN